MRPSLLFYCQHSVGLGHLMRSYALCAELAHRFRVVLVCGGPLPDGIAPPRGVEVVALPALGVGPRDIISILQAIKAAGALQADIEVIG